jgi:hypothetical protein
MEVYFNMHELTNKKKISFVKLKLEGRALGWWESNVVSRALEYEPPVTGWEVLKEIIKA